MEYGASIEELTEEQLIIICIKTMVNQSRKIHQINHSSFNSYEFFKNDNALPVNWTLHEGGIKINELKRYVALRYDDYLRQYLCHYVCIHHPRVHQIYIGCIL
jgi:hypothetical protein